MHHPRRVEHRDPCGDLLGEGQEFVERHRPTSGAGAERLALQQLHHEVLFVVARDGDVEDLDLSLIHISEPTRPY